ncbi:Endomucin, partial [Tinamus guttatus]
FAGVILPIVITLIVITLSVFSLVALYRMCQKKTPGTLLSKVGGNNED